jgi:transcriptional regulator with XRE-family HTH domain
VPIDPVPAWVLVHRRAVGARIREERRHAGLSQVQLGERVGRDHKTISRWENGHRTPSLDDLVRIAHALGTAVSDLTRTE